jgi:hypothetical protein
MSAILAGLLSYSLTKLKRLQRDLDRILAWCPGGFLWGGRPHCGNRGFRLAGAMAGWKLAVSQAPESPRGQSPMRLRLTHRAENRGQASASTQFRGNPVIPHFLEGCACDVLEALSQLQRDLQSPGGRQLLIVQTRRFPSLLMSRKSGTGMIHQGHCTSDRNASVSGGAAWDKLQLVSHCSGEWTRQAKAYPTRELTTPGD